MGTRAPAQDSPALTRLAVGAFHIRTGAAFGSIRHMQTPDRAPSPPRPRLWLLVLLGLACSGSHACPGTGPIKVLVPYSAGGSVDATTRVVARAASSRLGRPVTVVNVPGASGLIAIRQLLAAARDGCTVFSGSLNNVVLLPLQNPHAGFSTGELQPLARVGTSGLTLVANPSLGLRSLPDLRAAVAEGRTFKAGHPGMDSLQAVALKVLEGGLARPLVHVPYSGAGPLVSDLIAGHIDIAVLAQPAAVPLIARGAVVALDAARLPDGLPFLPWAGWFAAREVPSAALAPIRSALNGALEDSTVVRALSDLGVQVDRRSDERFVAEIAITAEQLKPLLASANRGASVGR